MYLKCIELTGFKSFTTRCKLDFEPGITAIVGPNGCGKSNVVDAIRWCLGEQSTRSLRCQNMLDVIFNGSQKRSAMGMAEVSLIFDNTTNRIPLDFNEIVVTRKLFRSNESEYFINHTQCRLKDIRDLFLDTGIGYEGYSIMEQGKIDFILNAKPEERRELFEEAAGVSKYQARRDESLRKMEKVQFDLVRIQDTISLVKDQIRQLDLAAKKAKQFKTNTEELKVIEIGDLLHKKEQIGSELSSTEEKQNSARDRVIESTALLDREEVLIEELRLELTEKEKLYSEMQEKAYKLDSEIALSENRSDSAKKRIDDLTVRTEHLNQEVSVFAEKLANGVEEYKNLIRTIIQVKQDKDALEKDLNRKEKDLEATTQARQRLLDDLQALKGTRQELETAHGELQRSLFDLSSRQSRIIGEQVGLKKECIKWVDQKLHFINKLSAIKEKLHKTHSTLDELNVRRNSAHRTLNEIRDQITLIQAQDDELNQKQLKICARLSALSEQLGSNPYHAGALAVLSQDWKGIFGPLHRCISIPEKSRYLLADRLGDSLNYFISETVEEAEHAVKHLKDNGTGRARFFVLETIPDSVSLPQNIMALERPLLSIMQYDERVKKLLHFILQNTFFKGSTIYSDHVIYGGQEYPSDTLNTGTGGLQEKDLLEEKLADLHHQRSDVKTTLDALNTQDASARSAVQETEQMIHQHEFNMNLVRTEVERIQKESLLISDEIKSLFGDLITCSQNKNTLQDQNKQITGRLQELDTRRSSAHASIMDIEEELKTHGDVVSRMINETSSIRITYSQLSERLQHITKDRSRILFDHEDMSLSCMSREKERQDAEQTLLACTATIEQETQSIDDLFKQKNIHDEHLQKEALQKKHIIDELHAVTERVHTVRQHVQQMQQHEQAVEIERQKIIFQEKNIESTLTDKFSLSLDQARALHEPRPLDADRQAKLRSRIESMGSVNLAAPEEYEQLEGRYTFLETQYQDIITAKEDLHRVIQKINSTTKENFKKTFFQVRENFKIIYQKLFEGGEADLRLTNEDNLLETGIDIFTQPPGKRLQNISLLSGGEKALTAAALLFAFFMTRPSPVCVLDEVDASLDEANVGRFVRLIRDFSRDTQFLMITHNKRSMEIANTLYGVTMEEYGVSKIISIKLADAPAAPVQSEHMPSEQPVTA